MSQTYITYPHNSRSENTIGKFFDRNNNLLFGISLIEFLRYSGGTGKQNITRIEENYTEWQRTTSDTILTDAKLSKWDKASIDRIKDLPLNLNTVLLIPSGNFREELISIRGKNQVSERKDIEFFFAEKLLKLLNDPKYVRSENILLQDNGNSSLELINENVQVWVWSRAQQKILDVSRFIQRLTTSKSGIGTFNFSLSPLTDLDSINIKTNSDFLNYFVLNQNGESNLDFWFKNFQYNDIVFIRFEKLEIDEDKKDFDNFEVSQSTLPGKVWDMIGLIDNVQQSTSYSNTDYSVSVSGRDFNKLLVEDGSYFINIRYLNNGESNFTFGFNRDGKWFKRNFGDKDGNPGNFTHYYFPNSFRRIDDTILFVANQLSNLGVLPDNQNIFSNYGDKRSKYYEISDDNSTVLSDEVSGVWQIIKFAFEKNIQKRGISDSSIGADGTMMEQINKVCQSPFVEFFGDTYGDEFNFITRQPPTTKEGILSFLYPSKKSTFNAGLEGNYQVIELNESDIEGYSSMEWDNTWYSWYQISPSDQLFGENTQLVLGGMVPIVYFDEICQYFGNNRLVVPDNYIPLLTKTSYQSEADLANYRSAVFNDLKYLIDSNSYLPFTRKGTIVIPKGDRRIKKGTFIIINPTREVFYVDGVSNDVSFSSNKVERSTTLQLSRGMLEKYILGGTGLNEDGSIIEEGGKFVEFSYFNVIRTSSVKRKRVVDEEVVQPRLEVKTGLKSISSFVEKYRSLVSKYFPVSEIDNALRIIQAESKGNRFAINTNLPKTGLSEKYWMSVDRGLFQINSASHPEVAIDKVFEEEYNIKEAARIFNVRGWKEWATSKIPGVIDSSQSSPINTYASVKKSKTVFVDDFDFKLDPVQFDFFLKRKQFNNGKI